MIFIAQIQITSRDLICKRWLLTFFKGTDFGCHLPTSETPSYYIYTKSQVNVRRKINAFRTGGHFSHGFQWHSTKEHLPKKYSWQIMETIKTFLCPHHTVALTMWWYGILDWSMDPYPGSRELFQIHVIMTLCQRQRRYLALMSLSVLSGQVLLNGNFLNLLKLRKSYTCDLWATYSRGCYFCV